MSRSVSNLTDSPSRPGFLASLHRCGLRSVFESLPLLYPVAVAVDMFSPGFGVLLRLILNQHTTNSQTSIEI